jgi:antitoxin MazE
MKLTKTSDGYIVKVPDEVVASLGLHDGDDVNFAKSGVIMLAVTEEQRERALDDMKRLARPLPPDYKFDREEANARR